MKPLNILPCSHVTFLSGHLITVTRQHETNFQVVRRQIFRSASFTFYLFPCKYKCLLFCPLEQYSKYAPARRPRYLMETFAFILIAVFSVVLVLFFVMMGFTLKSRLAAYQTGSKLAQALNLNAVSQARKASLAWFEGTYKNRPFALRIVGKEAGRGIESRGSYVTVLRLALAVHPKNPPGFKAKYHKKEQTISVYDVQQALESDEVLSQRASTAFWDFVHKGYTPGFHDGDLRFKPGTRELVFGERQALDKEFLFGKTVLPDASAVLVHDHVRPNRTAAEVQVLLDEILDVASVLEEDL